MLIDISRNLLDLLLRLIRLADKLLHLLTTPSSRELRTQRGLGREAVLCSSIGLEQKSWQSPSTTLFSLGHALHLETRLCQ